MVMMSGLQDRPLNTPPFALKGFAVGRRAMRWLRTAD
jgi:hypothetical protein